MSCFDVETKATHVDL